MFNRVYRLEIQSVMLVFSIFFVNCCPSTYLLSDLPHPFPLSQSKRTVHCVAVGGGGGGEGVELYCRPYSAGFQLPFSDKIQNLQNCYTTPNNNTSVGIGVFIVPSSMVSPQPPSFYFPADPGIFKRRRSYYSPRRCFLHGYYYHS
jgi:hypothetical protein